MHIRMEGISRYFWRRTVGTWIPVLPTSIVRIRLATLDGGFSRLRVALEAQDHRRPQPADCHRENSGMQTARTTPTGLLRVTFGQGPHPEIAPSRDILSMPLHEGAIGSTPGGPARPSSYLARDQAQRRVTPDPDEWAPLLLFNASQISDISWGLTA
ncbi:hypothetical protein BD413DRAFT_183444 [Trametes elegans]|nr:hypothetical protein BD413DRAFT_183444 [Trametes elegans]